MILPKLPRTTPAQSEVYWKESRRLQAIEARSIRLEYIKKYNIRFVVDDCVFRVFLNGKMVICVGKWKWADGTIDDCLYTMYKSLVILKEDSLPFIR